MAYDELAKRGHLIANHFRLGFEADGNDALASLIDEMLDELQMLSKKVGGIYLNRILGNIIEAQQKADYIYIADIIEYEIFG
ncbi:MAG: hypothetical protein OEX12_06650 [Gammaproteobacteria bacterium]|nr:hypothetical protein [Gammaproteobacteria bacterium]